MVQKRAGSAAASRDAPKLANGSLPHAASLPNGVSGPGAASDPAVAAIKAESAKKGKKAGTPPLASAPSLPLPSGDQAKTAERGSMERKNAEPAPAPSTDAVTPAPLASEGGEAAAKAEVNGEEEALLTKAADIRKVFAELSKAYGRPWAEETQPLCHWDFLLREARWLAVDFTQERLWKRALARRIAVEAAKFDHSSLRRTALGKEIRALPVTRDRPVSASLRERKQSNASAGTSRPSKDVRMEDAFSELDDLGPRTPPLTGETVFHYVGSAELTSAVEQHLNSLADMVVIKNEQAIREYEEEYESTIRALRDANEAARKRTKEERDAMSVDEEELQHKRKEKRKKARLPKHMVDDYGDPEVSLGDAALPAKRTTGMRKTASLSRPSSALFDTGEVEIMGGRRDRDAKRKRKVREYDDDDYEEPIRNRDTKVRRSERRLAGRNDRLRVRTNKSLDRHNSLAGSQGGRGMRGVLDPEAGMPWQPGEDSLLSSIVHEFGENWLLISDVLSTSSSLQGIFRSPLHCRWRFRELTQQVHPDGIADIPLENALALLRINKQSAREMLGRSLPVPDQTLAHHQKVLFQCAQAAKDKQRRAKQVAWQQMQQHMEPHHSIVAVQNAVLQQSQGRYLGPLEILDIQDSAQQAQQNLLAQQHHAQQQAQAQVAAQAAVQQGQGPPVQFSGPPGSAPLAGDGSFNPPSRQNSVRSQGLPGQMGSPVLANLAAAAMPPPGAAAPTINAAKQIQQLQTMLATGKGPQGQELTVEQKRQLTQKLNSMRFQQQAQPPGPGAPPAGGPLPAGLLPPQHQQATASQAALAQQQARVQQQQQHPIAMQASPMAGLPPGMPAPAGVMPHGGMQPGALQPTVMAMGSQGRGAVWPAASIPPGGMAPRIGVPGRPPPGMQPNMGMPALPGASMPGQPPNPQQQLPATGSLRSLAGGPPGPH